jgi:hypothetical protein
MLAPYDRKRDDSSLPHAGPRGVRVTPRDFSALARGRRYGYTMIERRRAVFL